MNQTEFFYYVSNGIINDPPLKTIWAGRTQRTANPFPRPYHVGNVSVGADMPDSDLAALGVYRLWEQNRGDPPGPNWVAMASGLVVDELNKRITRTEYWREMTAEEEAQALADAKLMAISANQAEAERRIFSRFPMTSQANILAGQDPDLYDACWGVHGWVSLHRQAENAAAALIEAATSLAEVEAVTVNWPEAP